MATEWLNEEAAFTQRLGGVVGTSRQSPLSGLKNGCLEKEIINENDFTGNFKLL